MIAETKSKQQFDQIERGEMEDENIKGLQVVAKPTSSLFQTISKELAYLSSLSAHTISGLYHGVVAHSYIANKRGETWTPFYSIQRSLVNAVIQYQGHNIQRTRFWYSNPITRLLLRHTLPSSVKITPFSVNINLKSLLAAEFDRVLQNIPINFIYTMPSEINPTPSFILTGEWITYETASISPSDRVILYIRLF